jgi:hypothetical protein
MRRYVQQQFGIKEDEDASMCGVGLCGCLTVCQDVSELQRRGVPLFGEKEGGAQTVQPQNPKMQE